MPLTVKSSSSKRGFKYTYDFQPPADSKPWLLFCHGFPDSRYGWRHQVAHFAEAGYGIVCPDMLGYGESDKPLDPKAYIHGYMAADLRDILDNEGIDKVVVIGHDWGVLPTSRFWNFFPDRVLGLVFLAAGYFPAKGHWDTEAFNQMTEQALGWPTMGYFPFQGKLMENGEESESARLTRNNINSFMALLFPEDPTVWKEHFCPRGKMAQWMREGREGPLDKRLSPEEVARYKKDILSDIETALNWYRVAHNDFSYESEQELSDEANQIKVPTLFIGTAKDYACQPGLYRQSSEAAAADFTTETLENAGHWAAWQEPDKVNQIISDFLQDKVL